MIDTMNIRVRDETPIYSTPRRLAKVETEFVTKQIEEWLSEGIIVPSTSEFSSPIVLVKKKKTKPSGYALITAALTR